VVEIDGEPEPPPENKKQAEALISRLGRDGYAAIFEALRTHFGAKKEDIDFAKNSAGTPDSASA
jgi:hypothetical protein